MGESPRVDEESKKKALILALRLTQLVEQGRWKEAISILDDLRTQLKKGESPKLQEEQGFLHKVVSELSRANRDKPVTISEVLKAYNNERRMRSLPEASWEDMARRLLQLREDGWLTRTIDERGISFWRPIKKQETKK